MFLKCLFWKRIIRSQDVDKVPVDVWQGFLIFSLIIVLTKQETKFLFICTKLWPRTFGFLCLKIFLCFVTVAILLLILSRWYSKSVSKQECKTGTGRSCAAIRLECEPITCLHLASRKVILIRTQRVTFSTFDEGYLYLMYAWNTASMQYIVLLQIISLFLLFLPRYIIFYNVTFFSLFVVETVIYSNVFIYLKSWFFLSLFFRHIVGTSFCPS